MAQMIHGFATGVTITGVTGPILIDFGYKAVGGTTKKLLANPGTGTPAATVVTTKPYEEMWVRCGYESTTLTAANCLGDALTLSVVSDNTAPATLTVTGGLVQEFKKEGKKGDWETLYVRTKLVYAP
jgi:hypothetical protein